MLAASGLAWGLFSGIMAGSLLVVAWGVLRLLRGVKELGRTARDTTEDLNRAMEDATERLRNAEAELGRISRRKR